MPGEPTPSFIDGLTLSQRFFEDHVRPIVAASYPWLQYAAALIGPGSEVLGYDDVMSTDHHWGPRVILFVGENDLPAIGGGITDRLHHELPRSFLGYSTNFGLPDEVGVRLMQPIDDGPVSHRVEVTTVARWFSEYLGWDALTAPSVVQWLTFPQHRLRASTTGGVFHDELGELTAVRTMLSWYPNDLWLYLIAAQWHRISDEEAFMARCGDTGDELGSIIVAARLVKDLMRLCFLMERQYAPYAKWFGRAFGELNLAAALRPALTAAIRGSDWHERERALSSAYQQVASFHNSLGITPPLDPVVRPFHGRPYLVIGGERFATALEAQISDDEVRRLPGRLGGVNSVVDSTDILESTDARERFRRMYE